MKVWNACPTRLCNTLSVNYAIYLFFYFFCVPVMPICIFVYLFVCVPESWWHERDVGGPTAGQSSIKPLLIYKIDLTPLDQLYVKQCRKCNIIMYIILYVEHWLFYFLIVIFFFILCSTLCEYCHLRFSPHSYTYSTQLWYLHFAMHPEWACYIKVCPLDGSICFMMVK